MKLTHTFRHLDISPSLTDYAENSIQEISRFLLKDGHGQVHYSKSQHQFCVEVSINTREKYFKATAFHVDAYAAVDDACVKLERQFLKNKSTHKNHKKPELSKKGRMKQLNAQLEYIPRYKKAA